MIDRLEIQNYLEKVGVDTVAAKIYLLLLSGNNPSVLRLSKVLDISRTKVESKLALLKRANLVSVERGQSGAKYKALPFENVDRLVASKQAEAQLLRDQFGSISKSIKTFMVQGQQDNSTRHHHGIDGLKQANWNLCNAQREYRVFEMARIPQLFGPTFADRCRDRMIARKLVSYNLTNSTLVPAAELEPLDPSITHYRHIDPSAFDIGFEVFLFDGVVTLVDNRPEVMEAIEIRNAPFFTMMRQMYDKMWGLGEPIQISQTV